MLGLVTSIPHLYSACTRLQGPLTASFPSRVHTRLDTHQAPTRLQKRAPRPNLGFNRSRLRQSFLVTPGATRHALRGVSFLQGTRATSFLAAPGAMFPSAAQWSQGFAASWRQLASSTSALAGLSPALAVPLPWALGLGGGLLIGAAASLLLLLAGRVMGASGILNGLLSGAPDWHWRLSFLLPMLLVSAVALGLGLPPLGPQAALDSPCSALLPATWHLCQWRQQLSPASLVAVLLPALAGALTGFGSQMGSGCTSGHGVCGLPRLSLRSLTAVATFMATGAATATLSNTFPAAAALVARGSSSWGLPHLLALGGLAAALLALRKGLRARMAATLQAQAKGTPPAPPAPASLALLLSVACSGLVFGIGLLVSGMLDRQRVRGFLDPVHGWDPSLAFVMGGAVLLNLLSFPRILKRSRPQSATCFLVPGRKDITAELVIGAAIFGIGWGLYGLCPAPGVMSLVTGRADVVIWNAALACGMLSYHLWR